MSYSEWDLVLLTAILIGVIVSRKVNRPQFLLGFTLIAIILFVNGLPVISDLFVWCAILAVLLIAAVIDEVQNDRADSNQDTYLSKFFLYRFTLKIAVLILSLPYPGFFWAAIGLWAFDVGYELAGWLVRRSKEETGMKDYSIRQEKPG